MKASALTVVPCRLPEIRAFVETHHYSHSVNGVKVSHCFAVQHDSRLVGGVIFGTMATTAWKKFANAEAKVLELRRLVLLDEAERNSESRVVGAALRWLKKNTVVEVVVSYADPAYGHSGTIYKAANFTYVGISGKDTGFRDPQTGRVYHSRALRTKYKGEYKPFVKRLRAQHERGELERIPLPGKYCFVYRF